MGQQFQWFIEITDSDTGQKFKEELPSPIVTYDIILSLIETFSPQSDLQSITLFYWKFNSWRLFLLGTTEDLQESHIEFETSNSNEILIQIKYHCEYFLENEYEEMIKEDLCNMNEKIIGLQSMYQQLREKYMQELIDINVFWGSPLFAEDTIARNRKGVHPISHLNGGEYQLLANQVKYAPYINAVTQALKTCNNKKVQLYLRPLNEDSFKKKSVFTISYIIAHVEMFEEQKKPKENFIKKEQLSKTVNSKPKKPENLRNAHSYNYSATKEESQKLKLSSPPSLNKESSYNDGEQIIMTIQETKHESAPDIQEYAPIQINHAKSQGLKLQIKQSIVELDVPPQQIFEDAGENSDEQSIAVSQIINNEEKEKPVAQGKKNKNMRNKGGKKRRRQPQVYMLGERLDGGLYKITPQQFKKMFEPIKPMDLLILHTSYPNNHLSKIKEGNQIKQISELKGIKKFKECAKNIILINSNPVYPQPSTIYYIKQFFIHLLQTGQISQSYELALRDLNNLKPVSLQLKDTQMESKNPQISHFFDDKQDKFMKRMKERWVHGSLECCCCYHSHYDHCKSRENNRPSKFAQYHYMFHTIHCECNRDNLMIHSCEQKKQILTKHLQVLDKFSEFKQFYFCCCSGYEMGYYNKLKYNRTQDYNPICTLQEQRDRHSIRFKYKLQKRMQNEQKFQFQIFNGHVQGDIGKNLMDAFDFIDKNSLIGNATVIIDLLEIFTKNNEDYTICNIIGSRRTGRKAIAKYFANLLIIKHVVSRYIIKYINSTDSLASIIRKQNQNKELEGKTFFIFIFNQKYYNTTLNVSRQTFGRPVSAIIISEDKVKVVDSILKVQYLQPKPFQMHDCLSYVKMYKHLKSHVKKNLQALFKLANKGFDNSQKYKLYPCELNQFQILNVVTKTSFQGYNVFEPALDSIHPKYIHYYLFLMSIIKFTTTPTHKFDFNFEQKEENLSQFQRWFMKLQQHQNLFYKNYDTDKVEKSPDTQSSSSLKQSESSLNYSQKKEQKYDVRQYMNEIINFERIRQHYFLIYACAGYRLKPHLTKLLKMFINYSTIIPCQKFDEDPKLRRQINHLRQKNSTFQDQVYQVTTINNNSYISRYFKEQIQQIYKELAIFQDKNRQSEDFFHVQEFLKVHSKQLQKQQRLSNRKSINENYSKPKERQKRNLETYLSLHQQSVDHQKSNNSSQHYERQQGPKDIPHIYHLAAVTEAGLQFIRTIISTHFIYSRMTESSKIQFLRFSVLMVNNCVILLKNTLFSKIRENFDLDSGVLSDFNTSHLTNKIYESTHRYSTPMSPHLQNIKSHDMQSNLPNVNRTYSGGKEILNKKTQFSGVQASAAKSNRQEMNQQQQKQHTSDEFLLKELYRLSTYKGLLYLLSEMERRCEQISDQKQRSQALDDQKITRMRVAIQLLGIQVRLEKLQMESEQTKIAQNSQDRHLARIYQIFTQKNYNIITLKRILRQQIIIKQRFPKDNDQLGIIKSHIIVALALMSSCYGKFKLVRGNFMIEQIDQFLNDWNQKMLFNRRDSQQDGGGMQRQPINKMHKTHPMFAFMKLISENQAVYLYIIESFNSVKFWPENKKSSSQKKSNQNQQIHQVPLYCTLLRLFHLFTLKNTKNKKDFYKKLEFIEYRLNQEFKKASNSNSFSAYIHNFRVSFMHILKKQMNKLASNLILILTAESDATQHDIKMSLSQKIEEKLDRKDLETQYFCIKKQLNIANLQRLSNGYKCNYLCIYTSPLKDDQKSICIQNNEKKGVCAAEKLVELLNKAVFKALFICLPKKKSLAQMLVDINKIKRIIYFDFSYNNFIYADQKCKDELLTFQKLIMVTIVTRIMKKIIQKQQKNSTNPIPQSISYISSTLGFMLVDDNNKKLIQIKNEEIRKCLFMNGDIFENSQQSQITIKLNQKDRIKASHVAVIEKFTKRLEEKQYDKKGFSIQLPPQKEQFLDVLSFYFKEKLSFHKIFRIDIQQIKGQQIVPPPLRKGNSNGNKDKEKNAETNLPLKSFYQKLTADKILQYIFSNKRVILTLQFKQYDKTVEQCERVLEQIMKGLDEQQGHNSIRRRQKFIGYQRLQSKKQIPQIIFYIFDYDLEYLGECYEN